jgi:hypothetical protein
MTPRSIDPDVLTEVKALILIDWCFTVGVMAALIAMDAMGTLPLMDAMQALAAFQPRARAK